MYSGGLSSREKIILTGLLAISLGLGRPIVKAFRKLSDYDLQSSVMYYGDFVLNWGPEVSSFVD